MHRFTFFLSLVTRMFQINKQVHWVLKGDRLSPGKYYFLVEGRVVSQHRLSLFPNISGPCLFQLF
jgi:hypothetical protein